MIRLYKLSCPNCGASLKLKFTDKDNVYSQVCTCEFCNSTYVIEDLDLGKETINLAPANAVSDESKKIETKIEKDRERYQQFGMARIGAAVAILFLGLSFNMVLRTLWGEDFVLSPTLSGLIGIATIFASIVLVGVGVACLSVSNGVISDEKCKDLQKSGLIPTLTSDSDEAETEKEE